MSRLKIFDMDDCLTKTQSYIHKRMLDYFVKEGMVEQLTEYKNLIKKDIKSLDFPKYYSDLIWKEVISDSTYMLNVKPTRLYTHFFNECLDEEVAICTHRGWNERGEELTKLWFELNNCKANIVDFHVIKSKEHPNKIEYLDSIYGDRNYILFDDNPLYDRSIIHPYNDKVRIFDEENKFKAYSNQKRIKFNPQTNSYLIEE